MRVVHITEKKIPPLRSGDWFDASGKFRFDAADLGAIYEIWDTASLAADLEKFSRSVARFGRNMASHLTDAHPDAQEDDIAQFLFDCAKSIFAHKKLKSEA